MNTIKRIGLVVYKKDVKVFYEEVLNFKTTSTFILTQENAINIFGIPAETTVVDGECPEMELELFVLENLENQKLNTFNHVCFFTERITEIAKKATQKGYKTFVLQHSGTLFVTDSNQNIFEIKQSI